MEGLFSYLGTFTLAGRCIYWITAIGYIITAVGAAVAAYVISSDDVDFKELDCSKITT